MVLISKNEICREGQYLVFLQPLQIMAIPVIAELEALGSRVGFLSGGLNRESIISIPGLGGRYVHACTLCLCVRPPHDSQG